MLLQLLHWRSNQWSMISMVHWRPLYTSPSWLINQLPTSISFFLPHFFSYCSCQFCAPTSLIGVFPLACISSSFLKAAVEHIGYSSFMRPCPLIHTFLAMCIKSLFIYIHSSALFSVPSTVNQDYISMLPCLISSTDVLLFAVHCQHTQEQH